MVNKRLTNSELAELILTELYDLAESSGYDTFWNMRAIANKFGESDYQKIFNVIKVLDNAGYVMPIYAFGGVLQAKITGTGSLLVENGGNSGIIKEYRRNPSIYINIENVTNSPISVMSDNVRQKVSSLNQDRLNSIISDMKKIIAEDAELTREQKIDRLSDIESLKLQMSKIKKNQNMINYLICELKSVASLKGQLENIQNIIENGNT